MTSTAPKFPQVHVRRMDLIDRPTYRVMSTVTDAMWHSDIPEPDMERYCAAVKDRESYDAIRITEDWITLT